MRVHYSSSVDMCQPILPIPTFVAAGIKQLSCTRPGRCGLPVLGFVKPNYQQWCVKTRSHHPGETLKQDATLARVKIDRARNAWIHNWVENHKFEIRCGPLNLSEAIQIFVQWFDSR